MDSNAIAQAILAAISIWLIQRTTAWIYTYHKIKQALIRDLAGHAAEITDCVEYMEVLVSQQKLGTSPSRSGNYYSRGFMVYEKMLPFIISGFTSDDFRRVQKVYALIKEFDDLARGFFDGINAWKRNGRELTNDDIKFLNVKLARLHGYKCYFLAPIYSLSTIDHRVLETKNSSTILTLGMGTEKKQNPLSAPV